MLAAYLEENFMNRKKLLDLLNDMNTGENIMEKSNIVFTNEDILRLGKLHSQSDSLFLQELLNILNEKNSSNCVEKDVLKDLIELNDLAYNEYINIFSPETISKFDEVAAERMVAMGFAISLPAISGAEPWMGSYIPNAPSARLAEGSIPIEPVIWLASSEIISPKILEVTITSKCLGFLTSCIAALSTYMWSNSTSG